MACMLDCQQASQASVLLAFQIQMVCTPNYNFYTACTHSASVVLVRHDGLSCLWVHSTSHATCCMPFMTASQPSACALCGQRLHVYRHNIRANRCGLSLTCCVVSQAVMHLHWAPHSSLMASPPTYRPLTKSYSHPLQPQGRASQPLQPTQQPSQATLAQLRHTHT